MECALRPSNAMSECAMIILCPLMWKGSSWDSTFRQGVLVGMKGNRRYRDSFSIAKSKKRTSLGVSEGFRIISYSSRLLKELRVTNHIILWFTVISVWACWTFFFSFYHLHFSSLDKLLLHSDFVWWALNFCPLGGMRARAEQWRWSVAGNGTKKPTISPQSKAFVQVGPYSMFCSWEILVRCRYYSPLCQYSSRMALSVGIWG